MMIESGRAVGARRPNAPYRGYFSDGSFRIGHLPHGEFTLIAIIPSTDPSHSQGIIADSFRHEFERFTLIYTFDNTEKVHRFREGDVNGFLAKADAETREALARRRPGASSGVVRKGQ
jgi:hypothetical protein